MSQTDTTIAETDPPDDDGDLLPPPAPAEPITAPADPTANATAALAATEPPIAEAVATEAPLMIYITTEHKRISAPRCKCGQLHGQRSDRFAVFEVLPQRTVQLCPACTVRDHSDVVPLLSDLDNLGESHGWAPPVILKSPRFANGVCSADCAGRLTPQAWDFVMRPPFPGQTLHEGRCWRCMETRYPGVHAVLSAFLGVAPLEPLPEPPPPPPPSPAQVGAAREARHHGIISDIIASCQPGWSGGRRYAPDSGAQAFIEMIDERIAVALASHGKGAS